MILLVRLGKSIFACSDKYYFFELIFIGIIIVFFLCNTLVISLVLQHTKTIMIEFQSMNFILCNKLKRSNKKFIEKQLFFPYECFILSLFKIRQKPTMLHIPSVLLYGFLSFSMAFLNKALFEISDFRNSLFVVFIQLLFVILLFQIFNFINLIPAPAITRTDVYKFLIPSTFYSLSTILSLQALMKLNVAIYIVIKVSKFLCLSQ